MEMIASMGVAAGVEKFRMSMSDLTNNLISRWWNGSTSHSKTSETQEV